MKENLKEIKELLHVINMVKCFVRAGALASPSVGAVSPEQIKSINDFYPKETANYVYQRYLHRR